MHEDPEEVTQGRACSTSGSGSIPTEGRTELLRASLHSCLENRTSKIKFTVTISDIITLFSSVVIMLPLFSLCKVAFLNSSSKDVVYK